MDLPPQLAHPMVRSIAPRALGIRSTRGTEVSGPARPYPPAGTLEPRLLGGPRGRNLSRLPRVGRLTSARAVHSGIQDSYRYPRASAPVGAGRPATRRSVPRGGAGHRIPNRSTRPGELPRGRHSRPDTRGSNPGVSDGRLPGGRPYRTLTPGRPAPGTTARRPMHGTSGGPRGHTSWLAADQGPGRSGKGGDRTGAYRLGGEQAKIMGVTSGCESGGVGYGIAGI
ncbi:MAG: hypothetical protein JWO38_5393 [Gemmataceae bacterium]|nr:hypothetical protein [Gemmataceae bacterium]